MIDDFNPVGYGKSEPAAKVFTSRHVPAFPGGDALTDLRRTRSRRQIGIECSPDQQKTDDTATERLMMPHVAECAVSIA